METMQLYLLDLTAWFQQWAGSEDLSARSCTYLPFLMYCKHKFRIDTTPVPGNLLDFRSVVYSSPPFPVSRDWCLSRTSSHLIVPRDYFLPHLR
jgi:hypothetical protein